MGSLPIVIFFLVGGRDLPPSSNNPGTTPAGTSPSGTSNDAAAPITGSGRLEWALKATIGPGSLFVGAVQAGWGNLENHPREYGQGMEGFGKRFGLRLSSVGTSNVMEAGLGAIWGEDPRYHVSHDHTTRGHFNHAFKMTFMAERADGSVEPAYARYIAYAGSNVISNAWRPDSQRTVGNTTARIGERFAGRLLGNLFKEYWPEMKQRMFRK
jgi:hypothetical protein